jgi:hypothetical protein
MARSKKSVRTLADLTCDVVSAYCARHSCPSGDLLNLITQVGIALARVSQEGETTVRDAAPTGLSPRQIRTVDRKLRALLEQGKAVPLRANDNYVAAADDGLDASDEGGWLVPFPAWNRASAAGLPRGDEQAS